MKKINCLIIEDEPLAAELIADYASQVSLLDIKGICHKAMDGLAKLKELHIDLIFLDLHMPGIKGFDFLKSMSNPPKVIVTTAYHQYALEGYDLNVIDYLIKPIEFPRFLKAIDKVAYTGAEKTSDKESNLFFTENRQKVPLLPSQILYVESQKDYVHIHTAERIITSKMTLHSVENMLPNSEFIRIHKSFIVAVGKIDSFNSQAVQIREKSLPVGRNYRAFVHQNLTR